MPFHFLLVCVFLLVGNRDLGAAECLEGDCLSGRSIQVYDDGARYRGGFRDGQCHGYGEMFFSDGFVYRGMWKEGIPNGSGSLRFPDGQVYEGDFVDGQRHGYGRLRKPEGSYYEGQWADDLPHGRGSITFADGTRYEGNWRQGEQVGQAALLTTGGEAIAGDWQAGSFTVREVEAAGEQTSVYRKQQTNHGTGAGAQAAGAATVAAGEKDKALQPTPVAAAPGTVPGRYPQGSLRPLSGPDLDGMGPGELQLMRNEIFARHGFIFSNSRLQEYFAAQAWYEPRHRDVFSLLSGVERANVRLIGEREKRLRQ